VYTFELSYAGAVHEFGGVDVGVGEPDPPVGVGVGVGDPVGGGLPLGQVDVDPLMSFTTSSNRVVGPDGLKSYIENIITPARPLQCT
jgi:hypothetical protein